MTTLTDEQKEIVRKAVGQADEWSVVHIFGGEDWAEFYISDWSDEEPYISFCIQKPYKAGLDTLAAQLVRQVDVIEICWVKTDDYASTVCDLRGKYRRETAGEGGDRTMNTLTAIVESGVLEND